MNASLDSPGWNCGLESHKLEGVFCPKETPLANLRTALLVETVSLVSTMQPYRFKDHLDLRSIPAHISKSPSSLGFMSRSLRG